MPYSNEDDGAIVPILEQLRLTADLEGLAVIDLSPRSAACPVAYCIGAARPGPIELGQALLAATPDRVSHDLAPDKRPILACPLVLAPAGPSGLVLWRAARSRVWRDSEHPLVAAVAMLLRVAIGADMGHVGIDRLTGLPNRRWFLDEADRHIDRLDIDTIVGTLLLLDVDDLRGINAALGRDQGDRVLVRLAGELRSLVRPGDVVARVGADEFAVWLDGMDHLTAAERAELLCNQRMFQDLPEGHGVTFSIGIASRRPGSAEDVRMLLRRAQLAVNSAKTTGAGGWRVSHALPISGIPEPPR